jgi:hypothetical protein
MSSYRNSESYRKRWKELEDEEDRAHFQRRAAEAKKDTEAEEAEATRKQKGHEEFVDMTDGHVERELKASAEAIRVKEAFEDGTKDFPLFDSSSFSNGQKIKAYIDDNFNGYISANGVKAALFYLKDELEWLKPAPTPQPVAPAKPKEVLGTLPNGERQLPLDASPKTMIAASKIQLADLSRRTVQAERKR